MIREDVRHLEMPDECVVRGAVTIGFTTKMVRTRKHSYIKKKSFKCVYVCYICV